MMKKTLTTSLFAGLSGLLMAANLCAQEIKADPIAGEKKAAMCIGCHGIPGYQSSFPEVHKVPMISGQDAKYISAALKAYATGGRKHPTMRAIAGSLTPQDMADLSAFYQQQPQLSLRTEGTVAQAPTAEVAALLQKGGCANCHGLDYSKAVIEGAPKLAGQHADYLYVALKSYQITGSPYIGRSNPIMGGIVKQFTPAELKKMSDYLASLKGDLRVVSQPRFR